MRRVVRRIPYSEFNSIEMNKVIVFCVLILLAVVVAQPPPYNPAADPQTRFRGPPVPPGAPRVPQGGPYVPQRPPCGGGGGRPHYTYQ